MGSDRKGAIFATVTGHILDKPVWSDDGTKVKFTVSADGAEILVAATRKTVEACHHRLEAGAGVQVKGRLAVHPDMQIPAADTVDVWRHAQVAP